MFALRWADIDLSAGSLSVRGTLSRDEAGRHVVGEPKTSKSRRRIDLGPSVVALLRKHKPHDSRGDDFVFVTEAGTARPHELPAAELHPVAEGREVEADPLPRSAAHGGYADARERHAPQGRARTAGPRVHRHYAGHIFPCRTRHAARGGGCARFAAQSGHSVTADRQDVRMGTLYIVSQQLRATQTSAVSRISNICTDDP